MSFTVTATQGGSTAAGMALDVIVVTSEGASQPGAVNSATSATSSLAITPSATGSFVYGSLLMNALTVTALAGTTIKQDVGGPGLEYVSIRNTGTTSSGTPVTPGVTGNPGISICLAEILAAGTIAEDSSSPGGSAFSAAVTATSGAFTPPGSSLLVAMVQSNGAGGVVTMALSDTSGLGLTWIEQVKQNATGDGYSGIWTAAVPSSAPPPRTTLYSMRMMP
jgi:hypothetical protein